MATYIIVSIIAYLLGSISFSVIFSKKLAGFDVREKGSGNAGTTNVLRTVGKKAAALTLLCDCLKGVFAVLVAFIAGKIVKDTDSSLLVQLAGIFVVLGHTFPVFFKFKGGKGVASTFGFILVTCWPVAVIALGIWLVMAFAFRYSSLSALTAAVFVPVASYFLAPSLEYTVVYALVVLLVIVRHHGNIRRLLNGEESKIKLKKQ
mgnify:CR=1 FL=1